MSEQKNTAEFNSSRRSFLTTSAKVCAGAVVANTALGLFIPEIAFAGEVEPKQKLEYTFKERTPESIHELLKYPGLNIATAQEMSYKAYFNKGG